MIECKYCQRENFEKEYKNELYLNLPIKDDYSEEYIDINEEDKPIQYIRENDKTYYLITEFNNEEGDVISLKINYCPICGRKVV